MENGVPVTSPGVTATDDEIEAKEKKVDEFEQKDCMAQHILQTTVSPRVAALIRRKPHVDHYPGRCHTESQMYKVNARRKLQA